MNLQAIQTMHTKARHFVENWSKPVPSQEESNALRGAYESGYNEGYTDGCKKCDEEINMLRLELRCALTTNQELRDSIEKGAK